MGGSTQVICKYYTVLYKRFEHLQILVSVGGVPETSPCRYPGLTVIFLLEFLHIYGIECSDVSWRYIYLQTHQVVHIK